eukprot:5870472-Amphidinium_carterae.1
MDCPMRCVGCGGVEEQRLCSFGRGVRMRPKCDLQGSSSPVDLSSSSGGRGSRFQDGRGLEEGTR